MLSMYIYIVFIILFTEAEAIVKGSPEVHIEEGSQLAIECNVSGATSPPIYIFWYHNGSMVNYEKHRDLSVKHEKYTSSLVVSKVTSSDAGIYTCDPHLAISANVTVHVVTGELVYSACCYR